MRCCEAQASQTARKKWWRGASGCAGSGILLALLPKCPLCLAAYLGLWMGTGWAMSLAHWTRPLLFAVLAISIASLSYRFIVGKVCT